MKLHRIEVWGAWALLILSILGWPISAMTWAQGEPQTVLGLSWLAITLTSLDFLKTARVHITADEQGSKEK